MTDESGSPIVRVGDVIAGKYRVERVLGKGAMGVVVAATHMELGELRAIKFMSPEALAEPEALERFLREARAAARLKSQHVTKVHDVGRLDSGAPYIVMEHLEGADLRTRLKKGGPLSIDEAVLYMTQACEALGEAHEAGIVHRDIKPGNLFLTKGVGGAPCIKVVDFGIAKLVQGAGVTDGRDLTATSAVLGTPKYMSPEQMRADRSAIDGRSDIWAMGVTLYHLLTRQLPFTGDNIAALCSAVLWNDFRPASELRRDLPAGLDAVIARCLAKDPAKRFQTASDLAAALLPFGSDEVQRAAPVVQARALAVVMAKTSGTHPAIDPAPHSTLSTQGESALAAGTAAPWTGATLGPRRSSWSAARIAAAVGFLLAGMAAGALLFLRLGARSGTAAPPAAIVASETVPHPSTSATAPPPAVVATATAASAASSAPEVTPAPGTSASAGAADAGAPRAAGSVKPAVAGHAHPSGGAGRGGHAQTDPFWQSRK